MLHKTRGLVFQSIDYGESSVVVKIYTEVFGIQSYLINSVRKKHARFSPTFFQPLTPLDLVVYHKERPGLQRISDARANPPLQTIPFDVFKSSIIFFLDEILGKCIREEEGNTALFDFIFQSVLHLDASTSAEKDFHLIFLIQLSKYLGFFPTDNFGENRQVFNLKDGYFQETNPPHPHFIPMPLSGYFSELIREGGQFSRVLTIADRRKLIEYILEFYSLHMEGFTNIKSHKILEQVWED